MCDCNDYPPEYYWYKRCKARKEHTCYECLSIIDVGEEYVVISGIWSKSFASFKFCLVCDCIHKAAYDDDNIACIGHLYETVGTEYEQEWKHCH